MPKIEQEYVLRELESYFARKVDYEYPLGIQDEDLSDHHRVSDVYKNCKKTLKVSIIGNPGWSCSYKIDEFNNKIGWKDIGINREPDFESRFDYFISGIVQNNNQGFTSFGGPQYLSVVLDAFRCFVTGDKFELQESEEDLKRIKTELDKQNPLLAWFSEFAFKHCDPEDTFGYIALSFYLVATQEGFAAVFMLEESDLADCEFEDMLIEEDEGKIHCYRKGDNIFIRTHFRGLIKGLTIFKDWAEKHRETWENIDWG